MSAMTDKIDAEQHQCEDRANARRGQRGKNSDGVNVAFVQNAQDDVHRDQCGKNQQRLIRERRFKGWRPFPGRRRVHADGKIQVFQLTALLTCFYRFADGAGPEPD